MIVGARSQDNIQGCHRDLIKVMQECVTPYQIIVTEGLRTLERQQTLVAKGASRTMNSRHLSGHAIDFAVVGDDGKVTWDYPKYRECAAAIKTKAKEIGVPVVWGGDWPGFKDGTHIQLTWADYPLSDNPKTPGNSKTILASVIGAAIAVVPEASKVATDLIEGLPVVEGNLGSILRTVISLAVFGFIVWHRWGKLERDGV